MHKVLNFHLFELTTAENEVAWANFVTKRLALVELNQMVYRGKSYPHVFVVRENT